MPKIEPKFIQKELEAGKVRPVYWIFGPERMKAREILRRIQRAVHQDEKPNDFNFEKLDGSEASIDAILDSAQSFSMMGGAKLIVVRNAEDLKVLEPLVDYLKQLPDREPVAVSELSSVLVFVSKGFDGRKKTSKAIQENATTVPCEEVLEQEREPWIDYLSKRRGIVLSPEERLVLRGLDPWSLDIVDQELGKIELVASEENLRSQVLMSGVDARAREDFIDALFCRDRTRALKWMHLFSEDMDVQLPILGLISWNLRQLKIQMLEQETQTRSSEKRNPYLQPKLDRWKKHWNRDSLHHFEHGLFGIDFSLKNTRLTGQGLWASLIIQNQQPQPTPKVLPAS